MSKPKNPNVKVGARYDQTELISLEEAIQSELIPKNKINEVKKALIYGDYQIKNPFSGRLQTIYIPYSDPTVSFKDKKNKKEKPIKSGGTDDSNAKIESNTLTSTIATSTKSNQDSSSNITNTDPSSTGGREPSGPTFGDKISGKLGIMIDGVVGGIGNGLGTATNVIGNSAKGAGNLIKRGSTILTLGTQNFINKVLSTPLPSLPSLPSFPSFSGETKKETRTTPVVDAPEVKSETNSVKTETSKINSMFSNFPFFRKSYSTLDQLTPFLDITVILPPFGTNFYGDNKELTLFNVPYNNVVSFEMESLEANKNSKLIIHDTTDSFFLAIYLYLQKTTSTSQIQTKIRYGWVDERAPRFRKREAKPIYNTSDLFSIMGVELSVEDSKNIFTLTLSKTHAKTPLDVSFKPFYHLSRTPLLGLAIAKEVYETTLYLQELVYDESFDMSKLSKILSTQLKYEEEKIAKEKLLDKYDIYDLRECEKFINNYYQNNFESFKDNKKITFDNYANKSDNFTGLIDDVILKFDSVPTPIALNASNQTFTPAEAFYFLCKHMRINMEFLNGRLSLSGKHEVYFLSLIDEKRLRWDVEMPLFPYPTIRTLKISDLTINENDSWIDLLKRVAKEVRLKPFFERELATIEIKEITITKTANYENDIQNVITFIEGYEQSMRERNIEESGFLKKFIEKAKSKIKKFKKEDDFDTLTLIIINPRFLSEEVEKDKDGNEIQYNSTEALEQLLNRKRNDVLQTYSVRPFKALGDTTFSSNLRNLSQEFFPDVLSFKPSLTGMMQTLALVGKVQNLKATGYSSGSVHYINNEQTHLGSEFSPLNTILYTSYPFFSTSQNYSNEYINNIADKNKFTEIFREHLGTVTAELVILGEPALSLFEVSNSKSIFIKVFNEDGTYSILSGLYTITNVKHSIASGKFTSTLTLRRDAALNKNLILNSLSGEIGFDDTIAITEEKKTVVTQAKDNPLFILAAKLGEKKANEELKKTIDKKNKQSSIDKKSFYQPKNPNRGKK